METIKDLNGRYNGSRKNSQRLSPSLDIVKRNNNIEKDNTMRSMKMVARGNMSSNLFITYKVPINNNLHFTNFWVLGNKGKVDKWMDVQGKPFKPQTLLNESTHVVL